MKPGLTSKLVYVTWITCTSEGMDMHIMYIFTMPWTVSWLATLYYSLTPQRWEPPWCNKVISFYGSVWFQSIVTTSWVISTSPRVWLGWYRYHPERVCSIRWPRPTLEVCTCVQLAAVDPFSSRKRPMLNWCPIRPPHARMLKSASKTYCALLFWSSLIVCKALSRAASGRLPSSASGGRR